MSTTPTHPPRPARWYYEMDLGEVPDLSPEELRAIAIRQSYSIAAILALHEDEPVVLPDADDWLMSYAARDYLPEAGD